MTAIVTPSIESTLEKREQHVEGIVKSAQKLDADAQKVAKNAVDALERATADSAEAENKLISSFREQSVKEKEELYRIFSTESRSKAKSLAIESETCFAEISAELDDIVKIAMAKIDGVKGKSTKRRKRSS